MAGKIWPNIGVFGSSGSGKSSFLKGLITELVPLAEYTVIVNNSQELSEFAYRREYIGVEKAARDWNPEKLAEFIRHYRRVHFEVDAPAPVKFMDALAKAVKSLGEYNAQRIKVLFIVDEAQRFLSKAVVSKSQAVQALEFEARKFGIVPVKATPRLRSSSQDCISHESLTQCRQVYIFPFNAEVDREAVQDLGFPDPGELQYPNPAKGWGPEYFARDMTTGQTVAVKRRPDGTRYQQQIAGYALEAA